MKKMKKTHRGESKDKLLDRVYRFYFLSTYWHYEKRDYLNKPEPSYEEAVNSWLLQPRSFSLYHDNRVGRPEEKYLFPDGREAVFDGDTHKLIRDPRLKATFNYVPPIAPAKKDLPGNLRFGIRCFGHFFADVLPYYVLGNERKWYR